MRLIAITGGIGSGKSVVSRVVRVMGYGVYDCDSRAKSLMTQDPMVRQQLMEAFGKEVYLADGSLNRAHLSAAFTDPSALARLNAIVHPATATDLINWADEQAEAGAEIAFVETALLRTACLDRVVDDVWHVTAPDQVRIDRVIARSGLTAAQVKERMAAQRDEEAPADGEHIIINDNVTALLPQIVNELEPKSEE